MSSFFMFRDGKMQYQILPLWITNSISKQSNTTKSVEGEQIIRREKIKTTQDLNVNFKHLKIMKKPPDLYTVMIKDGYLASTPQKNFDSLNEFFHSVYSARKFRGTKARIKH